MKTLQMSLTADDWDTILAALLTVVNEDDIDDLDPETRGAIDAIYERLSQQFSAWYNEMSASGAYVNRGE
jgi:hypothetical protein